MKCPHCENVSLTIAERSGVEIDFCPTCRGVWLDRGELDKIIDRAAVIPSPSQKHLDPPPFGHDRDDDDDRDFKKRKRKGFLEDLFDF